MSIKTSRRRHWHRSVVLIFNFEHIPHLSLESIFLSWNRYILLGTFVMALYLHLSKTRSWLYCRYCYTFCLEPLWWLSIYSWAKRGHGSTVVIVNFEHITPSSSLSTRYVVWSYISIIFRLRWIQVPLIYRKHFHELKYFHELACTAPCLILFEIYSTLLSWSA